jgi:hypothetical protein
MSLSDLMEELAEKSRGNADEIFTISIMLMALMEENGWDIAPFSGTMAAYFCPDKEVRKEWLESIAVACDKATAKMPVEDLLEKIVANAFAAADSDDGILSASKLSGVDIIH